MIEQETSEITSRVGVTHQGGTSKLAVRLFGLGPRRRGSGAGPNRRTVIHTAGMLCDDERAAQDAKEKAEKALEFLGIRPDNGREAA